MIFSPALFEDSQLGEVVFSPARLGLIQAESYNFHIFNNTERFVSLRVRRYLLSFLQVKYGQVHTDEYQVFSHSCFWKNES